MITFQTRTEAHCHRCGHLWYVQAVDLGLACPACGDGKWPAFDGKAEKGGRQDDGL